MAPATDPGRGARGTREDTCLVFAATSAVINSRDQRREEEEQLTGQDTEYHPQRPLRYAAHTAHHHQHHQLLLLYQINQNLLLFVHTEFH